jgi:hypothetical protein
MEDIKELAIKHGLKCDDIARKIQSVSADDQHKEIIAKTAEHKDMVGKCFKRIGHIPRFGDMNVYYRIISERACNEFRVSALAFCEQPVYWFSYQSSRASRPGDWFLGNFDFDSFCVVEVMADEFSPGEEISREEFDAAMLSYTKRLMDMPWIADHYRGTGILPTDPKWGKKNC